MSLQTNGMPQIINGDYVIGYTNGKKIKDLGWADLASLSSWYQEDPNERHLGLINLYSTMGEETLPMYKNFFKEKAVLEVNGVNGSFTYELPVTKSKTGVYTTEDTSSFSEAPGIDGTLFPIKLDEPFRNGDILTYDAFHGSQVIVSEDRAVVKEGDSWVHWVTLVDNNAAAWFPVDKLKAGIQYFKIGHGLGEYSTKFSGITNPDNNGTIKCEFVLGNHRGVETYYTMYANSKNFSGASVKSKDFINTWMAEQEKIEKDENGNPLDMFYVGRLRDGKLDMRTVRIGAVLEKLALLELMRLEAYSLIFQKGALINDINGTKRLNEGIYPQLRRGRIIKYSKPGSISLSQLRQASSYLYRYRPNVPIDQRRFKFKAGRMAYENIMALIQQESFRQVGSLAAFNGYERILPSSPVTGSSLTELKVNPVRFVEAMFPGVGWVEVEHDPSLDYQPLTDRHSRGFYGEEGLADSSYSAVIWDATDPQYVDVSKTVGGASLVKGGNAKTNMYYVKPEGEGFYMGYSEGRWSPNKATDIASSMKHMAREFWCHSVSAAWVKDISRFIIIELKR